MDNLKVPKRKSVRTDAIERATYLLEVAARFAAQPFIREETIDYDEATCDGGCLSADCLTAAGELKNA